MSKTSGKVGDTIAFTNQSENAKSFSWDFGDRKSSTDENPTHSFSNAGTYSIRLTVTGAGGNDSIIKGISILPTLTGLWYKTIAFDFYPISYNGTMNLVQHDDNSLTGSFVSSDGSGTMIVQPSSKIEDNSVTIEWKESTYLYSFKGTVNSAFTTISGTFTFDTAPMGTWSARKL